MKLWTISFRFDGLREDIAKTDDEEKARRVFDRLKAIHEEAYALWEQTCDDEEVMEEKLNEFSERSPMHKIAAQYVVDEVCLIDRDYPPDIEYSPLAALLHGDEA